MSLTRRHGFRHRLKQAVLGDPEAPLVFLGNFEVEQVWARGEIGLPRLANSSAASVTFRLDEHLLTLGGPQDVVVLKDRPDPGYLDYLERLGLALPDVIVPAVQEPGRSVTRDLSGDGGIRAELARLGGQGYRLSPHGVSDEEEELAAACRIPLAAPPAAVCKAVNSKIFSRRVAGATGLRQPPGRACTTLEEFDRAIHEARGWVARGGQVAVKDAFGVSGKGITVASTTRRLDRIHGLVAGRCERAGRTDLALTVEVWVDKATDLNYQFTIDRAGGRHFDFVKEALTEGGVHRGHRVPPRVDAGQRALLESAADALGAALFEAGYTGVVGVDALVDATGDLYPVIEVNARNNMSTYALPLQEQILAEGSMHLSRYYPLRLREPISFAALAEILGEVLMTGSRRSGLLVTDFATVNAGLAAAAPPGRRDGRLYGIVAADTETEVSRYDSEITSRLEVAGLADTRRS